MINAIENAIIDRLKTGLGRMVQEVKSYAGDLDGENGARAIARVPAVWIAYGGAKISTKSLANSRYEQAGSFVVMCATRSLRSEMDGRHGNTNLREVGSNTLIEAVLRLLSGQRLGGLLNSLGLVPKNVRVLLKNAYVMKGALSVVAIEFDASWVYQSLEDGRFPEATSDKDDPDYIFSLYSDQLSDPYPDFKHMTALILDKEADIQAGIELNMKD